MSFNSGLKSGDKITNADIVRIFECGIMGGMRRSKKTGTLVLISDDTKGLYRDKWENGILYYTGMGKIGDQVLDGNQNRTLYDSNINGVEVHLFEVTERAVYTYCGVVVLAGDPYKDHQPDDNNQMRSVWIFPLKLKSLKEMGNVKEADLLKLSEKELLRHSKMNSLDKTPKKEEVTIYYRDPYLKALVKRMAEGKCQWCGEKAPFIDNNGEPYLEEHHVHQLAEGGKDVIENVVAICPNCHRKIHILKNERDIIELEGIAERNKKRYTRLLAYQDVEDKMKKHTN